MIEEISLILLQFRDCFNRPAAFNWFVIVIMGFIVRLDHHGVSSIIRWLGLEPSLYTALLSFFRTSSWDLKCIQLRWWQTALYLRPSPWRFRDLGRLGKKKSFVFPFVRNFMKGQKSFEDCRANRFPF